MKIVKVLDNIVDNIYRVIFILIMLVGLYYIYDTVYVFYQASGSRLLALRPDANGTVSKEITEDYVSWLKIDNTKIDYPIMQGETNSTYLNRDPYGDFALSGSIFLDSRNASDFSDDYCLVYGHHMSNGFMFGALDDFYELEFYEAHQTGTITLKDGTIYDLDIFACIRTDANVEGIFQPQGVDTLLESVSGYEFYKQPEGTHIVALTTCLEPGSTKRTVVLAVMELREK